jgi:hypothetical protein
MNERERLEYTEYHILELKDFIEQQTKRLEELNEEDSNNRST